MKWRWWRKTPEVEIKPKFEYLFVLTVEFTNGSSKCLEFLGDPIEVPLQPVGRYTLSDMDGCQHWINWDKVDRMEIQLKETRKVT